jgi:hypothetical protein
MHAYNLKREGWERGGGGRRRSLEIVTMKREIVAMKPL